ncbi:MAG: hypothetical protein M3506_09435 [Chloroflexota bacterium]|nr:hypothetical protein [Chloroflexota bacterium]
MTNDNELRAFEAATVHDNLLLRRNDLILKIAMQEFLITRAEDLKLEYQRQLEDLEASQ